MARKACFFVHTSDPSIIDRVEFYKIDIEILRDLGFDVEPTFSLASIPSDADLYFVWWWTYAIFPVIRAKLSDKKVIITGTFNFFRHVRRSDFYSRPFYQRILIKQSARWADANIMVSQFEYQKMRQEITSKNVFYSPHVLRVEKYQINDIVVRQKNLFTVSWMSRSNSIRKCIPEIIHAAKILKNLDRPYSFLIAGKVENDAGYLLDLVKQLDVQDVVNFLGNIDERTKIDNMHQCGIYLQPTMFEGFGVAIAEALLCGAPTITSRIGGVPEATGDYCSYVDGRDPAQIAQTIIDVFDNYDHFLSKAQEGKSHVRQHFDYARRKEDIGRILEDLKVSYD